MSRETAERAIGGMFERQGRLNSYLVLGFIRSQIDLLAKTPEAEVPEETEAQDEVSEIDKIRGIIDDLTLDLGKYSFHDLFAALNESDLSKERKAVFNACLDLIGIRDDGIV